MTLEPVDAKRRPGSYYTGKQHRVEAEKISETEAAETGVGNTSRYRHQTPRNDITAYYRRGHTDEQHGNQGIAKKIKFENVHLIHSDIIIKTSSRSGSGSAM